MPEFQLEKIVGSLHKLINGITLSDSEIRDLDLWASQSEHNKQLLDQVIHHPESIRAEVKFFQRPFKSKSLWRKIQSQLPSHQERPISIFRTKKFYRFAAAAAILIVALSGWFFFSNSATDEQSITSNQPVSTNSTDIPPGSDGAILTLSDGKQIILDNTGNGEIAQEGDARVIKSEDGQLIYQLSGKNHSGETRFNTLTAPRGKQYKVVLPDGSKIALNAGSSIYYPSAFTGSDRSVTVTGEVYFDVAKDARKPFKVTAGGMTIEVLGTQFNVNAYEDESAIITTLVEGLVKTSVAGKNNTFIKPGQSAMLRAGGEIQRINNVDLVKATAWKNGVFSFDDDIENVMRQVARWYDVEVTFKDKISYNVVARSISRNITLSKLLHLLELTGQVHFSIEGKKIIVTR